jgi:hypothetical protein
MSLRPNCENLGQVVGTDGMSRRRMTIGCSCNSQSLAHTRLGRVNAPHVHQGSVRLILEIEGIISTSTITTSIIDWNRTDPFVFIVSEEPIAS